MTIYVHRIIATDGSGFLRNEVSLDPAFVPTIAVDEAVAPGVSQHELDSHEALKAIWNPATMEARQAVIDALPKIQVISTAGLIQ